MKTESYSLIFKSQTDKACCFTLKGEGNRTGYIWLPKTQIEVDGVSHESDFESLVHGEELDVYIPDWLAEDKGLL
jgi:hypothetical protein